MPRPFFGPGVASPGLLFFHKFYNRLKVVVDQYQKNKKTVGDKGSTLKSDMVLIGLEEKK
jgi:hypothetical protein